MLENVTIPVMKEQLEVIGKKCVCDICKNKIFEFRKTENGAYFPHKDFKWFTVTTGHYDWGTDSGDSVEVFQVCSYKCLHEMLDKYLGDAWGCNSVNMRNTEYFNCEHKFVSYPEEWNVE